MARNKPRTRYQWGELAMDAAGAIRTNCPNTEIKELALAIQICLSAPANTRISMFEQIDRLIDKVNGVEYESMGARLLREHIEKKEAPCAPSQT